MQKYIISSEQEGINKQVHQLFKDIKEFGFESRPRDFLCREIYFKQMAIDPLYPIMEYENRKFPYYYLAGELAWYLMMDPKLDYISKFSNFWGGLTNSDGTVNSNYGQLLFPEQLKWAKEELQSDINTRRAISFVNLPKFQQNGIKDFVCTMYLNFFIRENTLHMAMKIRSNDIIYGLSFDAPFFSFVLQHMYLWLKKESYPDLKLGSYFHFADNIHYYERHFDMVDKIVNETPTKGASFELLKPMFSYEPKENHSQQFRLSEFTLAEGVDDYIDEVYDIRTLNGKQEEFIEAMSPWIKIKTKK